MPSPIRPVRLANPSAYDEGDDEDTEEARRAYRYLADELGKELDAELRSSGIMGYGSPELRTAISGIRSALAAMARAATTAKWQG
jgi:hypothetical protein